MYGQPASDSFDADNNAIVMVLLHHNLEALGTLLEQPAQDPPADI